MEKRSSIVGGAILIIVGVLFLLVQLFPGLVALLDIDRQWPLTIVAVGGLFVFGALLGTPPLAIPGSIIAGTGILLYYQNLTGDWASWAYAWTLYPGFVGVGIILMNLLSGRVKRGFQEGGNLIAVSVVLFVIFAAFFNGLGGLGQFWPVILILAGLWLLLRNRFSRRR